MNSYKKYLAGIMAATMVAGSSFAAFAADQQGTGEGSGSLDIVEKSDVFDVIVPTSGASTTFNYILDPTGVISKTSAEKYGSGVTFVDDKTVYFGKAGDIGTASGGAGTITQYDNTSDNIVVTNKSSMDVNISVEATVASTEGTGITLVDNNTFATTDKNASLYLALTDGTTTNAIKAEDGAKLTSTIEAKDGVYETKYVDGKYVNQLKADATGFNTYSFHLTGDCNSHGNWEGVAQDAPPAVTVTWTVKDPTAGPQVTMTSDGTITMSGLTSDVNFAHSAVLAYGGRSDDLNSDGNITWNIDNWSEENGGTLIFTLNSAWLSALRGQTATLTVYLTNETTIVATCQF